MAQSGRTKSTFKKSTNAFVSIEIKDEELPKEKESSKTPESNPIKNDKVKDICKFFLNGKLRIWYIRERMFQVPSQNMHKTPEIWDAWSYEM